MNSLLEFLKCHFDYLTSTPICTNTLVINVISIFFLFLLVVRLQSLIQAALKYFTNELKMLTTTELMKDNERHFGLNLKQIKLD